jgi:hypothetical protein
MATMKYPTNLPLSGDVSQFIAPWSWFVRQAGQLGLVNINIGATPAPEIEAKVLDDVGSYGRQIGRMADAIEVLVATLDRNSLSQPQQLAISAFETQLAAVRAIKAGGGRGAQPSLAEPIPKFRTAAQTGLD